ncbi:hypothetical protein BGZ76_008116 [Entomortierella beljakovae]|nr:hypothetical protein BGZ76_008116 [Entomortierella beljakovae]
MAPHAPKFYLLSSAKKGKYLLDKGDAEQERKNIGKAISYYEEARKYCNDEAQKRLDKLSPILSIKNNVTQNSEAPHKKAKHTTQQYSLAGPYFPTLAVPSFISTPASASLSQESTNYTIHDAPSTLALANMFKIANEEEEMRSINMMIHNIIQQFDENFSSKESIQELAVLAAIPDQRIFIAIITQLLKVEKASPTFPELTIHGLAVILTSAPKEIDLKERQGLLNDILERLQYRLTSTRTENNSEELLPLLRALSALFDAMLCRMMRHVGRLEVFNPTMDHLAELASDDNIDPEISFMARYASQSLVYIGNDESLAMSVFRRGRLAIGIIADIKTAVLGFNVEVFDSVYEKIMSMSDYNNKLECRINTSESASLFRCSEATPRSRIESSK